MPVKIKTFKQDDYVWVHRDKNIVLLRVGATIERWRVTGAQEPPDPETQRRSARQIYTFVEDVTGQPLPVYGRADLAAGQMVALHEAFKAEWARGDALGIIESSYWVPASMRYRVRMMATDVVAVLKPTDIRLVSDEVTDATGPEVAPERAVRTLQVLGAAKAPKEPRGNSFAPHGYAWAGVDYENTGYAFLRNMTSGLIERWLSHTAEPLLEERFIKGSTRWFTFVAVMPQGFEPPKKPAKPERA